jgi:hypothetical protein
MWAVRLHPIIRFIEDPIEVLGVSDNYPDMEQLYFDSIEDPEIDDFYLELVEVPSVAEAGVVKL